MRPIKKMMVLCLLTGLFAGCALQNQAGDQIESATGSAAGVSGSAVREKRETKKVRYEAENKKYGIALPERDLFMEQLEDLIYRTYITRPTVDESDIYSYLKQHQALNQDIKVTLSYGEEEGGYFDEVDEEGRRYYRVLVHFKVKGKGVYLPICYNARGLFFYERDPLICEDEKEDEFGGDEEEYKEIEKESKAYTKWGEAVLCIDESIAAKYVLPSETDPQREQIRKDCLKQIEEYRREGKEYHRDCDIYIYDFQPGDDWLEGRILYTNLQEGDVPVSWLQIHVCYKGKKMETYNGVHWYPRSSGGSGYSLKVAKDELKALQEEMLPEHCFMAYRIKGGTLRSLKS